jgi:putative exporter of polyketide antibiotics
MNFEILIPITLFVCIAYAIRVVFDARVRKQMMESNGSQELVRTMIESEEANRRHASLRWGIIMVALAAAFGMIQVQGWSDLTAGALALLVGATGIGNLVYYASSRRLGAGAR